MKEKPQWYLNEINPYGLVPTIEHNGHIIRESLVVFGKDIVHPGQCNGLLFLQIILMRCGMEMVPYGQLILSKKHKLNFFLRTLMLKSVLMCGWLDSVFSLFSQFLPNFYKYYRNTQDEDTPKQLLKFIKAVEELIGQNGGPFIMGKDPSAIDFLIWPWFERFTLLLELSAGMKLSLCIVWIFFV